MADKKQLLNDLKNNIMDVSFEKKDGTMRVMKCTLMEAYLPPMPAPEAEDWTKMGMLDMGAKCKCDPNTWADAFCAHFKDADVVAIRNWFRFMIEQILHHERNKGGESPIIKVWEIGVGWRSFDVSRVIDVQYATP
jgi:hypothetical protein